MKIRRGHFYFSKGLGANKHLKQKLISKADIDNLYHEVGLKGIGDKNKLLEKLWCICKLSYILNFITKKKKIYANMLIN